FQCGSTHPPVAFGVAMRHGCSFPDTAIDEVGRNSIPPQYALSGADPDLSFGVALDSMRLIPCKSGRDRRRLALLSAPPNNATIRGSKPTRTVCLSKGVVGFPERRSIRQQDRNEAFPFPTHDAARGSHPHSPGRIDRSYERDGVADEAVLLRITQFPFF